MKGYWSIPTLYPCTNDEKMIKPITPEDLRMPKIDEAKFIEHVNLFIRTRSKEPIGIRFYSPDFIEFGLNIHKAAEYVESLYGNNWEIELFGGCSGAFFTMTPRIKPRKTFKEKLDEALKERRERKKARQKAIREINIK